MHTYLITFTCYGTHMHGQEGTIDRNHNTPGTPALSADSIRFTQEQALMREAPYSLDAERRKLLLRSIRTTCLHANWALIAAHVRSDHVHIIVQADRPPEDVMTSFKAHATRALSGSDGARRKRWTRHGSTRWLKNPENLKAAVKYVVAGQGDPMEVYCCDPRTAF